jgi:hypothetical protein
MMGEKAGANCQHVEIERLGTNNGMAFARCLHCRSVIVTQSGTSIVLPPHPRAESSERR